MQDANCVFKVPRAKKRRPNLYCNETLSDLDEVWDSPKSSKKVLVGCSGLVETECHAPARRSLKLDLPSEKNKSSDTVPNETSKIHLHDAGEKSLLSGSMLSHVSDEKEWFDQSRDKYTMGLLEEFNLTPFHISPSSEKAKASHLQQNDTKRTFDKEGLDAGQSKHFNAIFNSLQCAEESVHEVPDVSNVEAAASDLSPEVQDILIVRDESMANADSESSGSDVDLESLTPPVPRSPSDHLVPDFSSSPGSFLLQPCDHLSTYSHMEDLQVFDEIDNMHYRVSPLLLQQFSNSSLDHVVPDFYI